MTSLEASRRADGRWCWAMCVFVIVGLYAADFTRGPRARFSEPDQRVSAMRARETLAALMGEEELPHRAGKPENEAWRVRLLGALDQLGLQTWVLPMDIPQAATRRYGESLEHIRRRVNNVSPMANIVARIDGQPRSRPVVLATHYDSAYNAPGAGDAGQCVAAILETARALRAEPLKYEVWLLFTDAEEFGLWGSSFLIEQGRFPWGDQTPVVINFDARGDRGAVLLYETHDNNLKAMQVAASGLAAPRLSTSLMVNVYKRLPNGTDFTVYRQAGWCGWNFAVVAGADRYHTEEDTLGHLSSRSLQHFAAHAHGLLRRLDRLPPEELSSLSQSQPATFFDVLGWFLVIYPSSWNWAILAVVCILWLVACATEAPRLRLSRIGLVCASVVSMLGLGYGLGWSIVRGLQAADVLPRNFINHYEIVVLLFLVAGTSLVFALGRLVRLTCWRSEVIAGLLCFQILIGAACCQFFAGGAYLCLWPALYMLLGWLIARLVSRSNGVWLEQRSWLAPMLWCLGPAVLFSPTYVMLAQTLGPRAGAIITAAVALMLLATWIPLAEAQPASRHDALSNALSN